MGTFQADIQQKQKEIERHRNDLLTLYSELGFSIALIEQILPLGFATDEFKRFVEVDLLYEEARQSYERIKGFISQKEDRSRKIQQIEADIRALNPLKKSLYGRLGAIAYEAFGSDSLPNYLDETCTPIFADHYNTTKRLQNALEGCKGSKKGSLGGLQCLLLNMRLQHCRKQMLPLLVKAGSVLSGIGCEADIPGRGIETLIVELSQFKKREQALLQELDIHHSAVAKMRSQEMESPKNQLESSRVQLREMEKKRGEVSFIYGKALYEKLKQNYFSHLIGSGSIALVEQITLHLRRIAMLEKDIRGLQNLMKVEELEAQIDLEEQKIDHLRTQIEQSSKQISQVELSIARKREKIYTLTPKEMVLSHE